MSESKACRGLQAELAAAQRKISELETSLRTLSAPLPEGVTVPLSWQEDFSNLLSLINSSEDIIWLADHEKRLLMANMATIETFKKNRGIDIAPGMPISKMFPPDQLEYFRQIFESVLRGKTLHLNYSGTGDKEYAATLQPVRKENEIIGVSVFARDITKTHRLEEELRRYEQIIASTPNLVALIDRNYTFQVVNDAYLAAFNKKRKELLHTSIRSLLDETYFNRVSEPNLIRAFSGEHVQFEAWMDFPAFGRRFLSIAYHPLRSQALKPEYIVINAHDITDLKQAESDRQKIFEVSLDMLCVIDFAGHFKELNPAWTRTLGWTAEEMKKKTWLDLVDPEDLDSSLAINQRLHQGESVIGFENRYLCKDGSYKWLAWSSCPDPELKRIFSAVRDITNRKQMEQKLLQLATTDPLTGTNNRRNFIEQATAELKRSRRYGSQLAVAMLDIDHFKTINDRYGHSVGDQALKRLVDCCLQELRSTDIFGRFGGEEFAVVLVETDRSAAALVCQRLVDQISRLKIRTEHGQIGMTVSLGATMYSADDISIDSLLKRADDALYKAKNAGRNQIVVL